MADLPKPSDFFVGVWSFFAVLLPGSILALLLAAKAGLIGESLLFLGCLLAVGYIAGHLTFAIGSFLDPVYDAIFSSERPNVRCPLLTQKREDIEGWWGRQWFDIRTYRHRLHQLTHYAGSIVKALPEYSEGVPSREGDARPAGTYQWARAWLLLNSAEATAELDRLEADSKLFRSLTVISVLLPLVGWPPTWPNMPNVACTAAIVGLLSLWRYFDLRQKSVRACYLLFLQLHRAKRVQLEAPKTTGVTGDSR